MQSIREAKFLLVEKGQINEKFVRKEIAMSWHKSRLHGFHPRDGYHVSDKKIQAPELDIFDFCDRVIPEFLSYFITNGAGHVLHRRVSGSVFSAINDLSDAYVGTTSFSISAQSKRDSVVRQEEHYLDLFTKFTSRSIVIPNTDALITIFYNGVENEYIYMSVRNSVISYSNEAGLGRQAHPEAAQLSDYISIDDYLYDELKNKMTVAESGLPFLIVGKDSDALAWYFADKLAAPALRISHRGIPEHKLEDRMIDSSKKASTLIISDLDNAPSKYITLIAQIVDFILESGEKKKKQIIIASRKYPGSERIMNKLSMSVIDMDACLKDSYRDFDYCTIEEAERALIKGTLTATNWNTTLAAKRLGIGRATLYRKIKLYHFDNQGDFSK